MRRGLPLFGVLLFVMPLPGSSPLFAQEPPDVIWEFVYPPITAEYAAGKAHRAISLDDGSYVVACEYGTVVSSYHCLMRLSYCGYLGWKWNGDVAGISSVRWVEEYNGDLLATGTWNNVYGRRLMLARVSMTGSTVWRKTYNQLGRSWGMCLTGLPDSSIVVGGRVYSESSYIPLLIRTNADGNLLFSKTFEEYTGTITRVIHHNDMVYAFINTVNEAPVLLAVNQYTLAKEWAVDYTGQLPDDEGSICMPNSQSGLMMVAGDTQTRVSDTGEIIWQSQPPGSDNRTLLSAAPTWDGGYILSGKVNLSLEPDPGYHPYDGWLVRTDGFGNTLWWLADSSSTESTRYCSAEQVDGGGYVVCGSRSYPDNNQRVLVVLYGPETGIGSDPAQDQFALSVSPSPFQGEVSITCFNPENSGASVSVFDLSGRRVQSLREGTLPSGEHTLVWTPESWIPEGCYLINLEGSRGRTAVKAVLLH